MMMRRLMEQESDFGEEEGEEKKPEETVTVAFTATATWPLKSATAEELIIEALAIRKKIEGLDLEGKAVKTPEELEAMEEAAAEAYSRYGYDDGEPKPGKPTFMFMKKIDDAKLDEMKKAAFEKAKAEAAKNAALAERKVGPVTGLQVQVISAG